MFVGTYPDQFGGATKVFNFIEQSPIAQFIRCFDGVRYQCSKVNIQLMEEFKQKYCRFAIKFR